MTPAPVIQRRGDTALVIQKEPKLNCETRSKNEESSQTLQGSHSHSKYFAECKKIPFTIPNLHTIQNLGHPIRDSCFQLA